MIFNLICMLMLGTQLTRIRKATLLVLFPSEHSIPKIVEHPSFRDHGNNVL